MCKQWKRNCESQEFGRRIQIFVYLFRQLKTYKRNLGGHLLYGFRYHQTTIKYPNQMREQRNLWLELRNILNVSLLEELEITGTQASSLSACPWFWWWVLWPILLLFIPVYNISETLLANTNRLYPSKKNILSKGWQGKC